MQSLEWSPDCGAESARLSSPCPGDLIWADALTGTCWHVRQTVAQAALAPAVAEQKLQLPRSRHPLTVEDRAVTRWPSGRGGKEITLMIQKIYALILQRFRL